MIITLINENINIENNDFYCTLSQDVLDKLSNSKMLRRKTMSYKFVINNQEKRLICPMLKNSDSKNVVLWPSIKLPFRKYPVHVYIYAVALYLTSKISMRETALKVRKKFGLESFSHSTLSRVLKKLSNNIDEIFCILNSASSPPGISPPIIERGFWNIVQTSKYKKLLFLIQPVLNKGNEIEFSSSLNYNYFTRTQKFVI